MRSALTDAHVTVRGVRLPVVDCRAWRIHASAPECGKGFDVATCETCEARESREGDLKNPPLFGRPQPNGRVPQAARPALRGLGDAVALVTEATGIDRAVRRLTGGGCGCGKRREALNRLVPFRAAGGPQESPEASPPPDTSPEGGTPQTGS